MNAVLEFSKDFNRRTNKVFFIQYTAFDAAIMRTDNTKKFIEVSCDKFTKRVILKRIGFVYCFYKRKTIIRKWEVMSLDNQS